jgi:Na+/H+ antiporter NhaD/arsenite permease-like protein
LSEHQEDSETFVGKPPGRLFFVGWVLVVLVVFALTALLWRGALQNTPAPEPAASAAPALERGQTAMCIAALAVLLALFTSPLPREISALLVAAVLIVSRKLPGRQILDEIDVPILILFAGLFVVTDAFAQTNLAEDALGWLAANGLLPARITLLGLMALVLSNTIGNVPAVVMILKLWHGIPEGTLVSLAILSTLAGNLFLVGSLANLIVAERAAAVGVRLSFGDHARTGVPIALVSMLLAGLWLHARGAMAL